MFDQFMQMIFNNDTEMFLEELKYILECENINDFFIRGYDSLLNISIDLGRTEISNALLKAGADVNAHPYEGDFPISVAVKTNNLEMVKKLINLGAKLNLQTDRAPFSGGTALQSALLVREENVPMIDLLLENGADLNPVLNAYCNQYHKKKLTVLIGCCHVLGITIPENYQNNPIILEIEKALSEQQKQASEDFSIKIGP